MEADRPVSGHAPEPRSTVSAAGEPPWGDNETEACRHCPTPDVHPTRIGGILTYEGRCDPDTCEKHDHSEAEAAESRPSVTEPPSRWLLDHGASPTNPFADRINVVADTPAASPAGPEAVPQLDDTDIAALNELERDLAAGEVEHMGDVWQRLRAILDAPGQRALAARLGASGAPGEPR